MVFEQQLSGSKFKYDNRMPTNSIVVTGATGFIGNSVVLALRHRGYNVIQAKREQELSRENLEPIAKSECRFSFPKTGVQAIIHLSARAHITRETSTNPLSEYRIANVHATSKLAWTAASLGIKRFIYISTIGVHGRLSRFPITEVSPLDPHNDYAISKCEAEIELLRICKETGLEPVIIRPPLVYGPGVRANFFSLLGIIKRGIPLPFSNVENKRSLVSLTNITDFIMCCLKTERAAGETFLVSDANDISTKEIICKLAHYMGRSARLFPSPPLRVVRVIAQIARRSSTFDGLFGTLQVDISKARQLLGWEPPQSVDDGLQSVVHWYLKQDRNLS